MMSRLDAPVLYLNCVHNNPRLGTALLVIRSYSIRYGAAIAKIMELVSVLTRPDETVGDRRQAGLL